MFPSATTITDDRLAQIEIMAEDDRITARMVANTLEISISYATELIGKLVKTKVLEEGQPVWINNNWNKTFVLRVEKPKQVSMFGRYVKRDPLIKALFGDEIRDSEAAWVF